MCFLLFISSLNSFRTVTLYKSFSSLVKKILKYFILFDANVNGVIFVVSFYCCYM